METKGQLTELVRRIESGGEVILTRYGQVVVLIVPIKTMPYRKSRRDLLRAVRAAIEAKTTARPIVARGQDSLNDVVGMLT